MTAKRKADLARPPDGKPLGRRERIMAAATEVFLAAGYAAASMDAVARAAGVSKATIYAHFAGKNELFGTIIRDRCEQALGFAQGELEGLDARRGLAWMGRHFMGLLMSPEGLAMYRVVLAEAPRLPEVGEAFYKAAPAISLAATAEYLRRLDARRLLRVPDPAAAAEFFLGMLRGDAYLRKLLGLPETGRGIEQVIDEAVEIMLRAYAPAAAA